jgi:hypothetical protein
LVSRLELTTAPGTLLTVDRVTRYGGNLASGTGECIVDILGVSQQGVFQPPEAVYVNYG